MLCLSRRYRWLYLLISVFYLFGNIQNASADVVQTSVTILPANSIPTSSQPPVSRMQQNYGHGALGQTALNPSNSLPISASLNTTTTLKKNPLSLPDRRETSIVVADRTTPDLENRQKNTVFPTPDPLSTKNITKICRIGIGKKTLQQNRTVILDDAKSYGLTINSAQRNLLAQFVKYGSTETTCRLGEGERMALIRDLYEILGRTDFPVSDLERIAAGLKAKTKSAVPSVERAKMARTIIASIKTSKKHWLTESNPAWNTVYFRSRFPRDLKKEIKGVKQFKKQYRRAPKSPSDWSIVRILGYVKQ